MREENKRSMPTEKKMEKIYEYWIFTTGADKKIEHFQHKNGYYINQDAHYGPLPPKYSMLNAHIFKYVIQMLATINNPTEMK